MGLFFQLQVIAAIKQRSDATPQIANVADWKPQNALGRGAIVQCRKMDSVEMFMGKLLRKEALFWHGLRWMNKA